MNMNKVKMGGAAVLLAASLTFSTYQYAKTGEMGRAIERYKLQNERSIQPMDDNRIQHPAYQRSFVIDTLQMSLIEEKDNHSRLMMLSAFTILGSIGYLAKKWVDNDIQRKHLL